MRIIPVALALAAVLPVGLAGAGTETVPLYTNDDLDRMFGPPPPPVTAPVDKTTPEDWSWVEQYIDRQYARLDADRQYDLARESLAIAERNYYPYNGGYPVAWSLGYPGSVWWDRVHHAYQRGFIDHTLPHRPVDGGIRVMPMRGPSFGGAHGHPGGMGRGNGHR